MKIKSKLESFKEDILTFIDFRNKEKTPHDTIIKFPVIDSEHGVVKDGEIRLDERSFKMIEFIDKSYGSIYETTLVLLGI